MTFSIGEKLGALKRELAIRKNVYPTRVKAGKMRASEADREIALFEAIIADYSGFVVNQIDIARLLRDGVPEGDA